MLPSLANLRLGELPPSTPVNAIAEEELLRGADGSYSIGHIVQQSIDKIFPPKLQPVGHVTLIDGANLTYFKRAWNAHSRSWVKVPQLTDDALTFWRNHRNPPTSTVIMVMSGPSHSAVINNPEYLNAVLEQVRHIMRPNSTFHIVELYLRKCRPNRRPDDGEGCLERSGKEFPKTLGYSEDGTRRLDPRKTEKRCNYRFNPNLVPGDGDFERDDFEHYKCEYDDVLFTVFANTLRGMFDPARVHTMSMDGEVEKSVDICNSVRQAVARFGGAATATHHKYPHREVLVLLQRAAAGVRAAHLQRVNVMNQTLGRAEQVFQDLKQLLVEAEATNRDMPFAVQNVRTDIGRVQQAMRGAELARRKMTGYYTAEVKASTPGVHYYAARLELTWWVLGLDAVLNSARAQMVAVAAEIAAESDAEIDAEINDQSES